MNTGIQDAHNLAWKLAAVLQGWAHMRLLDTYEVRMGAWLLHIFCLVASLLHVICALVCDTRRMLFSEGQRAIG